MERICNTSKIEQSKLISLRRTDSEEIVEAILLHLQAQNGETNYVCWLNYCQHITDVKLDKGSGATERGDEIVCENHGAMFDKKTGECTYGPCKGAYLSGVEIEVSEETVYLTDSRYTVESTSPEDGSNLRSTTGESEFM